MQFKYYNILWVFLGLAVIIFIFMPSKEDADPATQITKQQRIPQSEKNGPILSYDDKGVLKTKVNYIKGIKNGLSYLYYGDGKTVKLEIPYANGKREGTSKKYYEDGTLYAATTYHNDKLHGIRKLYNSRGKLKAEITYGYGFPGIGLKEYLLNGNEKDHLTFHVERKSNALYLSISESCKKAKFYIGKLLEDQFFNEADDEVQLLMQDNQQYYIDLSLYHPSYLQQVDVICSCKTPQGNPLILKQRIDVSSLKNVNQ